LLLKPLATRVATSHSREVIVIISFSVLHPSRTLPVLVSGPCTKIPVTADCVFSGFL
jgi:hypothetical protein